MHGLCSTVLYVLFSGANPGTVSTGDTGRNFVHILKR
jgi:hypothetical protein